MAFQGGNVPEPPAMEPSGFDIGGEIDQPSRRRDAPEGLADLSQHFDQLSGTLQHMADTAAQTEGKAQAVADVNSGAVTAANPNTVFGQSYNDVAKQSLLEQRRAAMTQDMGVAAANNPNDPDGLDKALSAVRAGFGTSPFPDVDLQLNNDYALHRATLMAGAQAGLHGQMVEAQAGNYEQALETGAQGLSQSAAGATLDDNGAARIAAGVHNFVLSLAPYGPKTAFSVGGVDFPADESRAGAVSPVAMQAHVAAAVAEAKTTWFTNQQLNLPDATSKAKFADQMREAYQAGSPLFAGLDGQESAALLDRLDAQAQKSSNDEKSDAAQARTDTESMIDALQWGGDVDSAALVKRAQDTGDAGLIAKANFYASIPIEQRGVLKMVVARSLGLIPNPGEGAPVQMLDAEGAPIGGPTGGAVPLTTLHTASGHSFQVNSAYAANFQGFVSDLEARGYKISSVGGYNNRTIAGTTTPSFHAQGAAIDINPGENPVNGPNDLPADIAQIAKAHGLGWGGAWTGSKRDPMHFSIASSEGGSVPLSRTPGAPQAPPPTVVGAPPGPGVWTPPPTATPGTPAFAAWANTQAGFSSDPLNFARGTASRPALATVPPLLPQAPLGADQTAIGNWAGALRQRYSTGLALAQSYGVPPRILTNGEVDDYKSLITQNPGSAVRLAVVAKAALGVAGASQFLREIGQGGDVATDIHLADLQLMSRNNIVQSALGGMRLKAAGAKEPPFEGHAQDPSLNWGNAVQAIAPAFRFAPDALVAAQRVGELAHTYDASIGRSRNPADYLQAGLGQARGQDGGLYGGVVPVNGTPAVLPPWLNQDHVEDSLRALGDNWASRPGTGPIYANGQPMVGRDVARMVPVLSADGSYRLLDPRSGSFARGAHGTLAIHLDQAKAFLARAVPGSVLP